ncbi:hypothetical protein GOQ27_08730 [Clostridium sp. D2Q-11]|uniref:SipW-cognate class signal peptide n=1 Tax=Anaeromonas frigoriresistens TaxID=2683708 RepID=A0A942UYA1_9FIRM|nr:hypothetical protein [Anaeromonas frigoriresistens]MBS4538546.1 hypothetical protein [Anaeromonas frigoriresistens]
MAKRRSKFKSKYILVIVVIVLMNLVGVSYAYWTDRLEIDARINTASMNVEFVKIGNVKTAPQGNSDKELNLDIRDKDGKENNHLHISGTLKENQKGFVQFGIFNNSSIPVKYTRSQQEYKDFQFDNGLKVRVNLQSPKIEPKNKLLPPNNNSNIGNPKIQINSPKSSLDVGIYTFEIKLPFNIAIGDTEWTEDLIVTGSIEMIQDEPQVQSTISDENINPKEKQQMSSEENKSKDKVLEKDTEDSIEDTQQKEKLDNSKNTEDSQEDGNSNSSDDTGDSGENGSSGESEELEEDSTPSNPDESDKPE